MGFVLLAMPLMAVAASPAAPIPVILDTDLGDDIDDTWALSMLLGCPQLDTKLIVTAFQDTDRKTRLTAKILEAMGRTDIPLGKGVKTADKPLNQEKWLGDYSLDDYKGVVHEDGIGAMIGVIKSSSVPVTLLVIGPQTNIKAALDRDPSIARNARVVSMAGSVYAGYKGSPEPSPEWNIRADVEAAKALFAAPWDVVYAPLDTCGILQLTGEKYRRVADAQNPRARAVIDNYDQWVNRKHYAEDSSSILFDTLAVYLCFDESFCEMETVNLSIDDEGYTRPDENGRPVRCAVRWKDQPAFEELLINSIVEESADSPK